MQNPNYNVSGINVDMDAIKDFKKAKSDRDAAKAEKEAEKKRKEKAKKDAMAKAKKRAEAKVGGKIKTVPLPNFSVGTLE